MSHGAVAALFVEAHGVLVFPADEGVKKVIPLGVEDRFQRVVQRFSDAFAPCLRFEIDGRFGAPCVCRPGKGQTCIGIAENLPVFLPEKPRKLGGDVVVAAQEFFFAGWAVFKGGGRGQNVRALNGKHGAYVFLSGNPEHGNSSFFPPVRPADSKSDIFSFYYPNFFPSRLTFPSKMGKIRETVTSKEGFSWTLAATAIYLDEVECGLPSG